MKEWEVILITAVGSSFGSVLGAALCQWMIFIYKNPIIYANCEFFAPDGKSLYTEYKTSRRRYNIDKLSYGGIFQTQDFTLQPGLEKEKVDKHLLDKEQAHILWYTNSIKLHIPIKTNFNRQSRRIKKFINA